MDEIIKWHRVSIDKEKLKLLSQRSDILGFKQSLLHLFLWIITRRVEVQRCPDVPTAPKTMLETARFKSEFSVTMIALLPPSSNIVRASREATFWATLVPVALEPVNETKGIL